ncbi:MAG: phosphoribosylglycinamide formyltransferase [Pseudomonadota bacterium]
MKLKLGVLASGRGSNLQAIIDACKKNEIQAEVAIIISDVPGAQALERAKKAGLKTTILERKKYSTKNEYETALINELKQAQVDLVCLAGYMRIVGKTFLAAFPNRVINIHPALLPSFPGLDAQKQAWEYGVKVSGCTVHFVDDLTDHGPIILQTMVPVQDDDTVETLSERILKEEHKLYSKAIQLIAENKLDIKGRKVRIKF